MKSSPASAAWAQPFGAQYFDVLPDMITAAKGLTNGAIPMGAVFVRKHIYDAFMKGPRTRSSCFMATRTPHIRSRAPLRWRRRKFIEREGLLTRGGELAKTWEDAVHSLRGLPHVIDVRNLGLVAGIELESRPGAVGARAYEVFRQGITKRGC